MGAFAVPGSFRDPSARVYDHQGSILRGVDEASFRNFSKLSETSFYRELEQEGRVVKTWIADEKETEALRDDGWYGALSHERVPCISYAYEWTFSMLQDAAVLHLDILEKSLASGWTLKDSTPFNIQFRGARPVFIDIPSFVPRIVGDYWTGYRQFCMLFLYPLMLQAHLGIGFQNILRSNLDGLTPSEAARYFSGLNRLKRGVPAHVLFPAMMERAVERKERDNVPAANRPQIKQSDAMVIGLVQSLRRLVEGLRSPVRHTDWSEYANKHSYAPSAFDEKTAFVHKAINSQALTTTWDIGSNTGTFSRIAAAHSDYVLAIDGDHDAVEKLYLSERTQGVGNITPLVANLANLSPSQGWAGVERPAFDARNRPDLVLCLALIHHIALSANVPIPMFLSWLRAFDAKIIIEFVDRTDEMVEKLLANKTEKYPAYNLAEFERELRQRFHVISHAPLKDGKRQIYFCSPL